MRTTLYRAQKKKDKTWAYGFPFTWIEHNFNYLEMMHEMDATGYFRPTEIIPETLCECIGKMDLNNKFIFEQDVVSARRYQQTHILRVVFNTNTCAFEFRKNVVVGAYGEMATYTYRIHEFDRMKVIGNMIDNPDLLDKKE